MLITRIYNATHVRNLFLISLLTTLLLLPFINKAISSDAGVYVVMGRHLIENPLRPYDYMANTSGSIGRQWDISNNPPAVCYIIAGVIKVFGEKEIPLHAVFSLFAIIAMISMYELARELHIDPLLSALLLIASPAFLVNATDIMLDVPLLAFLLSGFFCIVFSERKGFRGILFLGWILLGVAVLTKYTALVFIPLILIWLLLNKKPWTHYLFALIPIAFIGGWCVHNMHFFGETQLFSKSHAVGFWHPLVKEIALITYMGGGLIFPLSILVSGSKLGKGYMYGAVFGFFVSDLLFNILKFSPFISFLFAFFLCAGVLCMVIPIATIKQYYFDKEVIFLAVWFFMFVFFYAEISAIIAVRYLLTLLPAAILLFVKFNENRKRFLSITAGAGILLSLFLCHADYQLASSYRNMAVFLHTTHHNNIYFTGSVGFQYYMERYGFVPIISNSDNCPSGSMIVTTVNTVPQTIHPLLRKRMVPVRDIGVFSANPFRTLAPDCQAGFHLNMYGLFPYSFSTKPLEKFSFFIVKD